MMETGMRLAVLELEPGVTPEKVKEAFRKKVLEHHPDKLRSRQVVRAPLIENGMQIQVQRAKEVLLSGDKLENYNARMSALFLSHLEELPGLIQGKLQDLLAAGSFNQVAELLVAAPHNWQLLATVIQLDPTSRQKRLEDEVKRTIEASQSALKESIFQRQYGNAQKESDKLQRMSESFVKLGFQIERWRSDLKRQVEDEIMDRAARASSLLFGTPAEITGRLRELALQLIYLARIFDNLVHFKADAEVRVQNILDQLTEAPSGTTLVFKLGMILEQGKVGAGEEDERLGKVIVNRFNHFKDVVTVVWNQQTAVTQMHISDRASQVQCKEMVASETLKVKEAASSTQSLVRGYEAYTKAYDRNFHSWIAGEATKEQIAAKATATASKLTCSAGEWPQAVKDAIPLILADVFCCLTILKSGESYKRLLQPSTRLANSPADADVQFDQVLVKPHNIQILTILRVLGFDTDRTELVNQVAQIRTGEGKSMVLGACSVLLALLGFRIRCVCYSEYLTQRDFREFAPLFDLFGVKDLVRYSTIYDYSNERISQKGSITGLTERLVRGHPLPAGGRPASQDEGEEILLIDEVDVFFGKDFYGKTYNKVAYLGGVSKLFRAIWQLSSRNASSRDLLVKVKQLPEYVNFTQRFRDWDFIVEKEVRSMCEDVYRVDSYKYIYKSKLNRLCIKVLDTYLPWFQGYITAFAYLRESEKGTFRNPQEALDYALYLHVRAGRFSYANIAPARIIGVSGTVEALGVCEWRVLNRFKIKHCCLMPSVYGQSNFRYGSPFLTVSTASEHFRDVTNEVNQKQQLGRGVLAFFRDQQQLEAFRQSPYFDSLQSKSILDETLDHDQKDFIIRRAATSGQATLCTAIFGRGTDFFCHDRRLEEAGGVHCVQAFVSVDECEEVQIIGRTARQGKKGSWALIVEEADLLQQLGLKKLELQGRSCEQQHERIKQARSTKRAEAFEKIEKGLQEATEDDRLTQVYYDALLRGDRDTSAAKLKEMYIKWDR